MTLCKLLSALHPQRPCGALGADLGKPARARLAGQRESQSTSFSSIKLLGTNGARLLISST
jgi:hypothetical protein